MSDLGVVVHAYDSNILGAEAGAWQFQAQLGQISETLSQKKKENMGGNVAQCGLFDSGVWSLGSPRA